MLNMWRHEILPEYFNVLFRTGANSPTNFTADQVNSTSIRVSWISPSSGPTVTGYRIYYQTVGNQGSVDVDASTTEYTINNLVVNDTYIITLVALSEHLPSAIVGPEIVIPGKTLVSGKCLMLGDMEEVLAHKQACTRNTGLQQR